MAKKIITVGPKGLTERVQGIGPIDSYSFGNLQVMSPYTVGELPEDRFDTIQAAIDQWDADGQPPFPIYIRPKRLGPNYFFSSPPNSAGQYVEDLFIPEQKVLDPKGTVYNSDDVVSLTLVGLPGPRYEEESSANLNIAQLPNIRGQINLAGSTSNATGCNLNVYNLALAMFSDKAIFNITEGIDTSTIHRISIINSFAFSVGDLFSNVNNRISVFAKNSELGSNKKLFSDRTVTPSSGLRNTSLIAEDCTITNLIMEGDECVPYINLKRCEIIAPVRVIGDNTLFGNFEFRDCHFDMSGNNKNRIPDGGSAIRISNSSGAVNFVNCTMLLERVGGANCSVLDLNTDCYLDAAISLDSLGTGDFAISSDGIAYNLNTSLRAYVPNGIPTTSTDGSVTVVNASVNLT